MSASWTRRLAAGFGLRMRQRPLRHTDQLPLGAGAAGFPAISGGTDNEGTAHGRDSQQSRTSAVDTNSSAPLRKIHSDRQPEAADINSQSSIRRPPASARHTRRPSSLRSPPSWAVVMAQSLPVRSDDS